MYKNLLIALLIAAFGPVAHSANPTSPTIVAKQKLVNRIEPIPTTTIFTPAHDGVYRLSAYCAITQAIPNSQSVWRMEFAWTDDAGVESPQLLYQGYPSVLGPFYDASNVQGGLVMIIEAKAGTPITYDMRLVGPPDGSAYSLYYVLEQIE